MRRAFKIAAMFLAAGIWTSCSDDSSSSPIGPDSGFETDEGISSDDSGTSSTGNASSSSDTPASSSSKRGTAGSSAEEGGGGSVSDGITPYVDANGDTAYIPAGFAVSEKAGETEIRTGLVVIGPDGSEFVWIPTTQTELKVRDFGSYFSGGSIEDYSDETDLPAYKSMLKSVHFYNGFYMGRYEASFGSGSSLDDYVPASKPVTPENPGRIWVQFSPQDATVAAANLYGDNATVQGFFPWGINWDTMLQWLIDSGAKTEDEVLRNSTPWGNYSDDEFSAGANGAYTGLYEEASANNIYDLAGNNWEWTQERNGSSYVMRGGGYNLMGGACSGSRYPAVIRDPLPGNDHHPNVAFRVGLFLTVQE